jgi:hypothetical protein
MDVHVNAYRGFIKGDGNHQIRRFPAYAREFDQFVDGLRNHPVKKPFNRVGKPA